MNLCSDTADDDDEWACFLLVFSQNQQERKGLFSYVYVTCIINGSWCLFCIQLTVFEFVLKEAKRLKKLHPEIFTLSVLRIYKKTTMGLASSYAISVLFQQLNSSLIT